MQAISEVCALYRKDKEIVAHLFLHCEFSSLLWRRFLDRCVVLWSISASVSGVLEAWRLTLSFGGGLTMWRVASFAIFRFI